jgi:predicted dehydrogenase
MREGALADLRFGIVGLGLMGREFASAAARWIHLNDFDIRPAIVAVCDANETAFGWFKSNIPTIDFITTDYRKLLDREDIDAIYCAVPHNLHEQLYTDIILAGKHLLAEKPFGIDLAANRKILEAIQSNPKPLVRCASEFPFYPGGISIVHALLKEDFGQIIEVECGYLHSSDINPQKLINWKRITEFNGEYGCMGDLGMHVLHIPLRFGWFPHRVHAQLAKIVKERPDGKGKMVPCGTWDNATIFGEVEVASKGERFPITLHTKRIAPGETNTWFIRILRQFVAIKSGERGAYARPAKGEGNFYAAHDIEVVDSTGAGDAYIAGVLAAWHRQQIGFCAPRSGKFRLCRR